MAVNFFTNDSDKYFKPDVEGGFLTDKTEIENEVVNKKLEVIDNLMLGNFDANGNYNISPEILEELIKTPKRMENSYNGIYFFISLKFFGRFGQLRFSCKFVEEENGYFAKLYLLEPMVKANGFYVNTNTFLLESIKGEQNKDFVNNVFTYFHVRLIEDNGDSKTEFEEEQFPAIFNRKWLLLHLQVKKDMALTQAQKKLFEKKLEVLDKTLTKEQMVIIKTEIKNVSKIFVKDNKSKYKDLNQVLDKVLSSGEIKLPVPAKEKIDNIQKEYSTFVANIKSLNVEKIQIPKVQIAKKQDKQENIVIEEKNKEVTKTQKRINFSSEILDFYLNNRGINEAEESYINTNDSKESYANSHELEDSFTNSNNPSQDLIQEDVLLDLHKTIGETQKIISEEEYYSPMSWM